MACAFAFNSCRDLWFCFFKILESRSDVTVVFSLVWIKNIWIILQVCMFHFTSRQTYVNLLLHLDMKNNWIVVG